MKKRKRKVQTWIRKISFQIGKKFLLIAPVVDKKNRKWRCRKLSSKNKHKTKILAKILTKSTLFFKYSKNEAGENQKNLPNEEGVES
jgi:hypothetical protein